MEFVKTYRVKFYTPFFRCKLHLTSCKKAVYKFIQFVNIFWTYLELKFLYAINYKYKPGDAIFEVHGPVKTIISVF